MAKDLVWFKKNVGYDIGVRYFPGDKDGVVLHRGNPFVSTERENLRDFKVANMRLFKDGLLIETEEPSTDWETTNVLSDTEITELTGSHMKLKSKLPTLTSLPILYKMLEDAKERERSKRTLNLIQVRIDELEEDTDFADVVLNKDRNRTTE